MKVMAMDLLTGVGALLLVALGLGLFVYNPAVGFVLCALGALLAQRCSPGFGYLLEVLLFFGAIAGVLALLPSM